MSFRSRTRAIQPAPRRRSLSSSRIPTTSTSSTNYYLSNSPSYSSNRPLSSAYPSATSYTPSSYLSQYSSRDNLYSTPTSRNSYYSNGTSNGISSHRRDSYGGTTYKNPYASDRYISPYSTYDNGVTTASLCLSSYGGKGSSSSPYTKPTSYKSDYKTDYKTDYSTSRHSNLAQSRHSGSNSSISSYTPVNTKSVGTSTSATGLSRSQSVKDPEHKSRSARRSASMKSTRSLSISSEKSEGYEVRFR